MIKRVILFLMVGIMIVMGTACQPTPNQTTIASKNKDLVQEVVEANKEENKQEIIEDKKEIIQQIESLDRHLTMQIDTANPLTKINVDAEIKIPQYDAIPLLRLKPKKFTIEQFNNFIKYFAKDNTVYYRDENSNFSFSKDELESILPMLKQRIKMQETDSRAKNYYKNIVNLFEDGYKKAIRKEEEKVYDEMCPEFTNNGLVLKSYLGADKAADLILYQEDNNISSDMMRFDNQYYNSRYSKFSKYEGADLNLNISYEDAKQLAYEAIALLDGDDTNFILVETTKCSDINGYRTLEDGKPLDAYMLMFNRNYNGINAKNICSISNNNNCNFNKIIEAESIFVIVDDRGIVTFNWRYPSDLTHTIADDVPLLPFDQIEDTFKKFMKYKFSWTPTGDTVPDKVKLNIDINKVELNLMVTAEKDSLDTYLLVPVWDFIGDITYPNKVVCTNGEELEPGYGLGILTINAIDGTVIDRRQGY
jgi:hypothetical protein